MTLNDFLRAFLQWAVENLNYLAWVAFSASLFSLVFSVVQVRRKKNEIISASSVVPSQIPSQVQTLPAVIAAEQISVEAMTASQLPTKQNLVLDTIMLDALAGIEVAVLRKHGGQLLGRTVLREKKGQGQEEYSEALAGAGQGSGYGIGSYSPS
jgi:hypothetical protein